MKTSVLLALVALSGCGLATPAGRAHYHAVMDCRGEAGPEPYAAGHLFGAVGSLVTSSRPEHRAWQDGIDGCVDRRMAGFR